MQRQIRPRGLCWTRFQCEGSTVATPGTAARFGCSRGGSRNGGRRREHGQREGERLEGGGFQARDKDEGGKQAARHGDGDGMPGMELNGCLRKKTRGARWV